MTTITPGTISDTFSAFQTSQTPVRFVLEGLRTRIETKRVGGSDVALTVFEPLVVKGKIIYYDDDIVVIDQEYGRKYINVDNIVFFEENQEGFAFKDA